MNTIKSISAFVLFLALTALSTSCSDDTDSVIPEPDFSVVEDEFVINAAFEDLDFLLLDVIQSSGLGLRTTRTADLCSEANVTHNTASKTIVVDFGASGCTSPNGVLRKGKITLVYTSNNFLFPGASIATTFEGYEVEGIRIDGTRTLTNAGIDLINTRVTLAVKVTNGRITWPDNSFVTYSSDQTRTVSLGSGGYEASVNGTASGTSRKNRAYTATVSKPLIIKESCVNEGNYFPSSGEIAFSYENIIMSVDYGLGECDRVVVITYPGGVKELTLD